MKSRCGRRCIAFPAICCWSRWGSRCSPRDWSIWRCIILFVRPMRRLTANLVGFHENPESAARIIVPSQRGDEIGVAERELSDMQRDLVSMLSQKSRLAALGLAVSKINHDLRNLLASSQLLSDQLASVPDPRVQRFAPKLMRSLERAIDFCQSTLSYGRAQEAEPDRRMILVEPVVTEVRESAGLAADASITWISAIERGLSIDADPDQLFRVLLNLVRNAAQALESRPRGEGCDRCRSASPAAAKARSPSSRFPTPAPACRPGRASICSRRSRPPAAPAAAGWALRSPPNWSAPMAATSTSSKAPSAPPSGSRSPTARWNCRASATSGRGRKGLRRHSGACRCIEPGIHCGRDSRVGATSRCEPDPPAIPRRIPHAGPCQARPERVAKALFRDRPTLFGRIRALKAQCQAKNAPVAQLDRAPDYKSGGQEFESLRARHFHHHSE